MPALAQRKDPNSGCRFLVEIEGLIVGGFSEVTGLQAETQFEDYHEGGVNDFVHRLPRETRYTNLTLKRGITDSDALWQWHQDVVNGKVSRKNGYVILLDSEGAETWRWNFLEAYPVKWVGPDLRGDSSTVALETVELAHKGIKKA